MANRLNNAVPVDANNQPIWGYQTTGIINTNTTTTASGVAPTIFHGIVLLTPGTNWTGYAYDNATTSSGSPIFSLTTTTPGFIAAGDIVCANGLTFVSTQGTAGAIRILYI